MQKYRKSWQKLFHILEGNFANASAFVTHQKYDFIEIIHLIKLAIKENKHKNT